MRNWYELAVAKRGRSTVLPLTRTKSADSSRLFSGDDEANPLPDVSLRLQSGAVRI